MKLRAVGCLSLVAPADAMRTSREAHPLFQASQLEEGTWTTSCFQHTEKYGDIDRWVAVTPKKMLTKQVENSFSAEEWAKWRTTSADDYNGGFAFQPFILRGRKHWHSRPIIKVTSTLLPDDSAEHNGPDECVDEWSTVCKDSEEHPAGSMAFYRNASCANDSEMILGGVSAMYKSICTRKVSTGVVGYRKFWDQRVSVYLAAPGEVDEGQLLDLPPGHCAVLSPRSASSGIELEPLDADIMGTGLGELARNRSKVQRVLDIFRHKAMSVRRSMEMTGETLVEGVTDISETSASLSEDLSTGSQEALSRSLKWIKIAVLTDQVESCLCCDMNEVPTTENMADHCMVAYTLGGTNSSDPYNYYSKVTAGTLYKLSQTAAGAFVPVVGGKAHAAVKKLACRFACDNRIPEKYEEYAHGTVRMIPGVALKTWFVTGALDWVGGFGAPVA